MDSRQHCLDILNRTDDSHVPYYSDHDLFYDVTCPWLYYCTDYVFGGITTLTWIRTYNYNRHPPCLLYAAPAPTLPNRK